MTMNDFFYYGRNNLSKEIQANVEQAVTQPHRSMFYYRSFGCDIPQQENSTVNLIHEILLKYSVVKSIAQMNEDVINTPRDHRVITSQNFITVEAKEGQFNIFVQYIPLYDTARVENFDISLGGL